LNTAIVVEIIKASLLFLLLSFSVPAVASAQTVGATMRGIVTGAGIGLPNVQVTAIHEETDERRRALSGPEGEFALSLLPPGSYRIEAESAGFRKSVTRGIVVQVGQDVRVNLALEAGPLAEEVIVTAAQGLVKQDSASAGTVVENRLIVNLPLDGRNFLELSLLVAGAAAAAQGSPGSIRGEFSFNVNGAREDSNNYLLDGVYNNDPKLNSSSVNPPVDAIREFEVLTSSYDARYGRNGGAQVNVALKSGTNRFHGTAYEFFRNAALDARNFFARPEDANPRYQRHQFGLSLGGPVRKGRTFFFGDYEGRRVREGITQVTNVPTASERNGDFSRSPGALPVDPLTQRPFAGGRIPASRIDRIGSAIAALYPLPNRTVTGENFVSSPALRDRDDRLDVRLDHTLVRSSSLIARYSFADRTLYEPFSGPGFSRIPGYGTNTPRRAQNLMLGENHVFSSAWVNEARFSYNRVATGVYQENMGQSVNRLVGLPELSSNPRDSGLSFINISNYSPLGDEYNNPQHGVANVFQVADNTSYARGKHLVRFGFEYRALEQNAYRDVQARGFLIFSDFAQITGNGLADLLLGFVSFSGGARLDNPQRLRSGSWNLYLQESYRLRPNLTLVAGVRYEFNAPAVDEHDRASTYDPASESLIPVGAQGVPRGGRYADRNDWAPRVGIAWTPWGDSTAIHAGYGLFYDQAALAPAEGLYFNRPYYDFNLYFPLPGLPLTVSNPFPIMFPFSLPGSALGLDRNQRTAYMQHWNFKMQRQLGPDRLLEFAYVGSKGVKLLSARDINQPQASPEQPNPRPVPEFADITFEESRASSSYHSFQASFRRRYRAGVTAQVSYTLAKSLDNASTFFSSSGDANFPQDSWNLAAEKGRSNFDARQRLSVSHVYELPFGPGRRYLSNRGWISALLAGWSTSGIITLQTGRPFTVALLPEIDISNTGRATLGFGANDRPDRIGDGEVQASRSERWFDTGAFVFPRFGCFGNSGRNILDGPGYKDVSVSLVKNTARGENLNLQFRAEFFNSFNNTNFSLPDVFLGSPTFGRILSAQSPRRIQFGLKLIF